MNKTFAWILGIIVVAFALWYFAFRTAPAPSAPTANVGQTPSTATTTATTTTQSVMVTYTDAGFSPKSVTITTGETVTWVNQSSGTMWVASAVHPSHAVYDGTALAEHCANSAPKTSAVFDECTAVASSTSWSFTFTKAGTWKYHNHASAGDTGSVVVTEPTATLEASTTVNVSL